MAQDPFTDARDAVTAHFPQARWALLTGSVTTDARTPGSDLDIVVRLPDGDPAAGRSSLRWRGWPVEFFANDEAGHRHYLGLEPAARRPVMHRMIARGVPVHGDGDPELAAWRAECAAFLAAGPGAPEPAALDRERYMLTDLIDDLEHARDEGERVTIAAQLWLAAANLALLAAGHWTGTGKWLLRELRDLDPALAARWTEARHAPAGFAREVLDGAGGALFDGYSAASASSSSR
ncbi:nucleotidyltransferase [Actinorhabdospora filicis]|uniref:Nucleotidyltransferase n=1 Tax=Actinorhabdospora filicis TaxID=1785913 RepID=A0A9W6SFX2_9ACTN|nr:nucleotidyltransferase domain-containing protein [Actinorhabdospora filicis]GLZ75285.1 nucleotidyltransferase [Actinorhabdospora filicis]